MIYKKQSLELEYYKKEGISPVHYNISNLQRHFQIRKNLYRLLGVIPNFLSNKNILEVAAGSGYNSIFTASLNPKSYDLVEPNIIGCKDIINLFKNLKIRHTKPKLYIKTLDDFDKKKLYDLVITEGWPGGYLSYDKSMFKKLSHFVKPGGLLFLTFLPPIGAISTYIRRLIANRLIKKKKKLSDKTQILKEAFSQHLKSMNSMTRSFDHWIQDSLLNPYIVVGFNNPEISLKILGQKYEIYNSVPKLATDWRWYKSIHGKNSNFNKFFLNQYYQFSHCLIDYNISPFKRSLIKNKSLEKLCIKFALLTQKYESYDFKTYKKKIQPLLKKIICNIKADLNINIIRALNEADYLLCKKEILIKDVAKMKYFSKLFGREQCYLSLIKKNKY